MKKIIVLSVVSVVLFAAAIGINLDVFSTHTSAESECCKSRDFPIPPAKVEKAKRKQVPEYVPYMFLFRHVANLMDKPGELADLREKSGLSKAEFGELVTATTRYKEDVYELDARATVIIDEFHRTYPPGKLPPGTGPGQPPDELIELQNRRNQAALDHRDRLKNELGAGATRLEEFVVAQITPGLEVNQ